MLFRSFTILLSSCFLLAAQTQIVPALQAIEDRAIGQLLVSADPAEQAWGANFVATHKLSKWAPEVQRLMASSDTDVQSQALDALIQIDASVPSAELMRIWPPYREATLILLAKNPAENKDALHTLVAQQISDEEWVAVHNLLISFKDPELALQLLRALEMKITVTVVDTNIGAGWGGGAGVSIGCGGAGQRPGFPPMVFYRLSSQPTRGDVLLTPGLHPIYYHRQADVTRRSNSIDRNAYRFHFLAELMGARPENLALEPYMTEQLVWKGADAYVSAMKNFRNSAERRFRLLLSQMQGANVLSARDAENLKLQLKIQAVDLRENRQPPLPAPEIE